MGALSIALDGNKCFSTSVEETLAVGELLGHSLVAKLTIGLVGPLGAGKTQLVKGIAVGNGLDDVRAVTSPTFTLVHQYPGRLPLYHLDAYRLSKPKELVALGIDEMGELEAAIVVEWADRVSAAMPEDTLWIELTITSESSRQVTFHATGPVSTGFLDAVRAARR